MSSSEERLIEHQQKRKVEPKDRSTEAVASNILENFLPQSEPQMISSADTASLKPQGSYFTIIAKVWYIKVLKLPIWSSLECKSSRVEEFIDDSNWRSFQIPRILHHTQSSEKGTEPGATAAGFLQTWN